jgi:hypothetical protein
MKQKRALVDKKKVISTDKTENDSERKIKDDSAG